MGSRIVTTDIDIDFADRDSALSNLLYVKASRMDKGHLVKHPTGTYFQEIPIDPFSGCASIPYQEAGNLGYFKIDFLNNSLYQDVRDDAHLDELVAQEPPWELLEERAVVRMLAHVGDHFGVVQRIAPKSVEDLAVVLALIRPGKRHLLQQSRTDIDAAIWQSTSDDEYTFKKAHAIAYAVSIAVQLNLIVEKTIAQLETEGDDAAAADAAGNLLPR